MSNEYLSRLEHQARQMFLKLTIEQEKKLIDVYNQAGRDLIKRFNSSRGKAIRWATQNYIQEIYQKQENIIKKYGLDASGIGIDIQEFVMKTIGKDTPIDKNIKYLFGGCKESAFAYIMGPDMYSDGKTLSSRIWNYSNGNGKKIQDILMAGIARGASSAEISKALEGYVIPDMRKYWDRKKIEEILGPGYARSFSNLEYNSLRLARTTVAHAFEMGVIVSAERNPFTGGIKWHLSESHFARMRGKKDICDEYATQDNYKLGSGVFPTDKVPFDHPNGLCYQTVVFEPDDLESMADQLKDWSHKKKSNPRIQEWYDRIGKKVFGDFMKSGRVNPKNVAPMINQALQDFDVDFSDMKSNFTDEEWKEISKAIKKAPDWFQNWYKVNQKALKFDDKYYDDVGAWYSPNTRGITINLSKTKGEARGSYSTFFHEFGHLLDHLNSETIGPGRYAHKRVLSANPKLIKAIKEDYENILNSDLLKNKPPAFVRGKLTDWLRADGDFASGAQDIYSGLTLNKVRPKWGHDTDYWLRGDTDKEIASEAFAHMSSGFTNEDRLKVMKKWFPKACKVFEELVKSTL